MEDFFTLYETEKVMEFVPSCLIVGHLEKRNRRLFEDVRGFYLIWDFFLCLVVSWAKTHNSFSCILFDTFICNWDRFSSLRETDLWPLPHPLFSLSLKYFYSSKKKKQKVPWKEIIIICKFFIYIYIWLLTRKYPEVLGDADQNNIQLTVLTMHGPANWKAIFCSCAQSSNDRVIY